MCLVKTLPYVEVKLSLDPQTQGWKKKIRVSFVSFVLTFINLKSYTYGNAPYAENLTTMYPICFAKAYFKNNSELMKWIRVGIVHMVQGQNNTARLVFHLGTIIVNP